MSIDESTLNQLIGAREIIAKEYFRFKPYLSTNLNKGWNVSPLRDDTSSRKLTLIHRSKKRTLNCLLMGKTWKIFKNIKNLENLFFSEFAPQTVSNKLTLYSECVDRYVFAVSVHGICGHIVGNSDFRSDQTPLFSWHGKQYFTSYNYSCEPRVVLIFDIWK